MPDIPPEGWELTDLSFNTGSCESLRSPGMFGNTLSSAQWMLWKTYELLSETAHTTIFSLRRRKMIHSERYDHVKAVQLDILQNCLGRKVSGRLFSEKNLITKQIYMNI